MCSAHGLDFDVTRDGIVDFYLGFSHLQSFQVLHLWVYPVSFAPHLPLCSEPQLMNLCPLFFTYA